MSQPTVGIGFSASTPAAPAGYQNTVPQSDGGTPQQKVSNYIPQQLVTVGVTVDGGLAPPTTGIKGIIRMPYAGTITGWSIIADQAGTLTFDIKKATFTAYPTASSITASAKPSLSSAQKNKSTTLTGWTTSLLADDVLEFSLTSISTSQRITLQLTVQRT